MTTEICAECGGAGSVEQVGEIAECEWCDGTGEVAAEELLPPPAPPQLFEVTFHYRDHPYHVFYDVVSFDIAEGCYRMIDVNETRATVPLSGVYFIETVKQE